MFLFVCFVVCVYHSCSGGDKEDYIKCELIGVGSPRHLFQFLLLLLAVHYTYINTRRYVL